MFWFKSKRQKAIEAVHQNTRLVAMECGSNADHWETYEFRDDKIKVCWTPDRDLGPSTSVSLFINEQWVQVFQGFVNSKNTYRYKPGHWETHLENLASKALWIRVKRKDKEHDDDFGPIDDAELFGQDFLHLVETKPNPGATR